MNEVLNNIIFIDDDAATNVYHKAVISKIDIIKKHHFFDEAEKALNHLLQPKISITIPDLILLDINMPRINGWDFLDNYVSKGLDKKFDKTKIVMLTTSSNPVDKLKADSYVCVSGLENKILNGTKMKNILTKYC